MAEVIRTVTNAWMRLISPLVGVGKRHEETAKALRAARIAMYPEWYLGLSYFVAIIVGVVAMAGVWLGLGFVEPYSEFILLRAGLTFGATMFATLSVVMGFLAFPRLRASGRTREIAGEMQHVTVLSYALARGGVNALDIFRFVAEEEDTYGEIAVEYGVVVRNVEWMGMDMVSALKEAARTSPSPELRAYFEGLVTIINSGADPKDYFRNQAERQMSNAEVNLERDLEQAGLLAEVYVSGLLVLPLLLIVVMSGLAPLGGGQEQFIPLIIFAFIPVGTALYLLMLEMMLPPEDLAVPKHRKQARVDFGLDSLPADQPLLPPPWKHSGPSYASMEEDAKAGRGLRFRLFVENLRWRMREQGKEFVDKMVGNPMDAMAFSAALGLILAVGGGWYAYQQGYSTSELAVIITGMIVAVGALVALPVSVFHEMRVKRARRVQKALPSTLSDLAGFNERGIGLLQSFQILGRAARGPLADELRAVGRDVEWNGNLMGALRRLRTRVATMKMTKLTILLERASQATGNLKDVLDIAARDAAKTENIKERQHQSMLSYVVVIYIVFAVFIYVVYMVANLFYGPEGFGSGGSGQGLSNALGAETAKVLFTQAVVILGIGCGFVAGRLGEGHILSGLKHAAIMGAVAFAIFYMGVL